MIKHAYQVLVDFHVLHFLMRFRNFLLKWHKPFSHWRSKSSALGLSKDRRNLTNHFH